MQSYQRKQWNTETIKLLEKETKQALFKDEQTLLSFSQDFGKLIQSPPAAVCIPRQIDSLQSLITFAHHHQLPVTIRGNGLSQCGQSLANPGGLTVSMQHFDKPLELLEDGIWVEANTSWSDLLAKSLPHQKAPFILPYNCNLSVAGVLSAGGIGSSSFKYGSVSSHVVALEIIDGLGVKQIVDSHSSLYNACLSGQGQFGVITKACIKLRKVSPMVKTFCLVYTSEAQWFDDIFKIKEKVDYMEAFCSPSIQGAQLKEGKRVPMAQWLYALHVSVEYEGIAPELDNIIGEINPWKVMDIQEETISSYFLRHNSRFEVMKMLGQWDLIHPWYECFVGTSILKQHLPQFLQQLPLHYASCVHVVPVAKQTSGFLMLPEEDSVCSLMILNPGMPGVLKDSCLQAIQHLDSCLLKLGSKRYLSGYLGSNLLPSYWSNHFGDHYSSWLDLKKKHDPARIFSSMLHPSR